MPATAVPLSQGLCLEFGVVHIDSHVMFTREAELGTRAWHIATLFHIDGADGLTSRGIANRNVKQPPSPPSSVHYGSVGTKDGIESFNTHLRLGYLVSVVLQVSHGRPNDVLQSEVGQLLE